MREWQTVTVAFSPSSSEASGRPTRIERPTITASAPSSSAPAWRSSSITPCGVHGTSARAPLGEQPGAGRGQPVDVLGRVDRARSPRPGRCCSGSGSWTRMPSTSSSALSSSTSSSSSSVGVAGAELVVDRAHPDLLGLAALAARRRSGRRGRRRPAPSRARARRPSCSAANSRDAGGDPLRDLGGDRLAIDAPRPPSLSAYPLRAARSRPSACARRRRRRSGRRSPSPARPRSRRPRRSSRGRRRRRPSTARRRRGLLAVRGREAIARALPEPGRAPRASPPPLAQPVGGRRHVALDQLAREARRGSARAGSSSPRRAGVRRRA